MVRNFFKKGLDAALSRQTSIFSAAFFIVLTTILSQILGFVKYRLLVSIFGASNDLGVLFAAFRVPDFIFQVVIAGAISSSFIPIFTEYITKEKRNEAFAFTSTLMNIGMVFYVFVSIVIFIFSFQIVSFVAPGFSHDELVLMAKLMRIIQAAQVFFMLGTIQTATLQSLQHFLVPGLASALYNLGIIMGIIIFVPFFGIYGAAIGVCIGAFLFCASQFPILIMHGFSYKKTFQISEGITKLFRLMIPRSLTLIITQIAVTGNVFFASFLSARSLVIFDLAQTLVVAPVLLFGQSIAQASFPSMALKANDKNAFLEIFLSSFGQTLFLTLPVSVLLIVLRIPIVRLFYGAERFDWDATVDTGLTLAYFALSVTAQSLIFLFARAFYAQKDTKTPFFISLFCALLNLFLAWYFITVQHYSIYFLALATSVSYLVSIFLLAFFLDRKIHLPKMLLLIDGGKIVIASVITGVALYLPIKLLDQLVFDTTRTLNLLALTTIASFLGLSAYIFLTWLLDIKEAYYFFEVIKKFGYRNKTLKNIGETIGM